MSRHTPRPSIGGVNVVPQRGRSQSGQNPDYEEFASLQLDKPSEGELKSTEEMKRHMFDDHFEGRVIDRAMHILAVGEEVQRLSIVRDIVSLIQADEQGCLQRVIQKIQQALNTATTEFHIETARSFSVVIEKKAVSPTTFTHTFLPTIIYHLDNRDQVVSNAWLETLLVASELLPLEIVKSNILVVAVNKGQISQNVWQRVSACKLLGKMCPRFDTHIVKKDILPVVLSLCQDVNEAVRACICSQLHLVARGMPADMIKTALIPILVELGRDEIIQVRVEAMETIVKTIPFISQDLLKATILPLVKKICEQAVLTMDDTLVMVSKQFGSLCIGLENVLPPTDKLWMVIYYNNLSHMGLPLHGPKKDMLYSSHNMDRIHARHIECRQYCAYNFPAMAKFCSSSPELLERLFPAFCDFSTDPYYMVRKRIGAGMHEVARILGSNNRVVKNQVLTLLWDTMEEVLMGIVPNLGRTIDFLIAGGVLGHEQDTAIHELGRGLLQCDKTIREKTHNWRLYTDFITQLESIVKCLPSDYIFSNFVSLMFDKMHRARPLPCRLAAARTLLILLRYNLRNNQRQEIRSRLQSEFCLSSSCYKRMLYLRLCVTAREVFSRAYFKEHFFYPLLSRSDDKVPNNRLLLIRQFPSLKAMIVMPSERKHLQTLESCVRSMALAEKDRDVTAELRVLIHRLDRTETLSDNPTVHTAEDVEDRKKYEEEVRVANFVGRPGIGYQAPPSDRRVPKPVPRPSETPPSRPTPASTGGSTSASTTSGASPRTDRVGSYSIPSNYFMTPNGSVLNTRDSSSSSQGFINSTNNLCPPRSPLSTHITNIDQNCTCFPGSNFRSENLRNLNLLALLDANLFNSNKEKLSEAARQRLAEDPRIKMTRSAKHGMEISWLNLETDLEKELFALAKTRQIHGDRNLKEKSRFLSDFRNYNESSLRKFISEDRDYKERIYSVTGIGVSECCRRQCSNFFEERINFFERKIKSEEPKPAAATNPGGDCACSELGTDRGTLGEAAEINKFSYFSKNFEEDFYRDAGVKAHDVIGRRFSGIPVQEKQVSAPKLSASVASKRRTWFGNENSSQGTVKLETITGYKGKSGEKKKSETLPARESVSLRKLGIGPRSKSFVLPGSLVCSSEPRPAEAAAAADKENADGKPGGDSGEGNQDASRFGFRTKPPPKGEAKEKPVLRTKIPVGRPGNGSSPAGSRASSPIPGKEKPETGLKPQANGTKKIPVVASRKSLLIQSSSAKAEARNNRRSLDPTKINLANLEKPQGPRRRSEKAGKENGGAGEDKADPEPLSNGNSSKLPIRRPRADK